MLRSAWRDYDVAMLLANRYKRVCKIAFFLQLLFGWASVAMSSLSENLQCREVVCREAMQYTHVCCRIRYSGPA